MPGQGSANFEQPPDFGLLTTLAAVERLGFGHLSEEPKRLRAESERLRAAVQKLSVDEYSVHIDNHACMVSVREGLRAGATVSSQLSCELPSLAASLRSFRNIGTRLCEDHHQNRRTLEHHTQLLELLEIPQLMDTCVRNNLCDEALDLCSFAGTLQKRHLAIQLGVERSNGVSYKNEGRGLDIINAIVAEVDATTVLMRRQLLQQLRGRINLPSCLRVISYLKRLDALTILRTRSSSTHAAFRLLQPQSSFAPSAVPTAAWADSEKVEQRRLRLEFLGCRDYFMASLAQEAAAAARSGAASISAALKNTPGGTSSLGRPYQALISLVERNRVNLFDIITQYKAIFASGTDALEEVLEDDGILSRWLSSHIMSFMATLCSQLELVRDCASLANVLEQCMYFGMSLARVGADFRTNICPLFEQRIITLMTTEYWDPAADSVREELARGPDGWGQPLPVPTTSLATASPVGGGSNDDGTLVAGLHPPMVLLCSPVLAVFTNRLLLSFNDLRHCAPLPTRTELGAALHRCLKAPAQGLRSYDDSGSIRDDAAYVRFCELVSVVCDVLLPYVERCFHAVFTTSSEETDLLQIELIADGLRELLPVRKCSIEEDESNGAKKNV